MDILSKTKVHRGVTKNMKAVRFVDPTCRFDSGSSISDSHASIPMKSDELPAAQHHQQKCIESFRDPDLYCVERRSSISEQDILQDIPRRDTAKADGSPVESILKKGKISKYSAARTLFGSDSSLASNPWNISHDSHDLIAPLIPERYISEDVSTDDSLEASIDSSIPTAKQRRESNRDVFLRQFLRIDEVGD
ncbi:unnamed protein product [Cylindrotheca closterium]|uniref:Uncharacterized protein n=1 Tax=Cylindrotheca closterium TaxID=2856 RepID=A0AAD2CYA0_9STRA|nr:unnamed protein product [Cylindrotheca closterium]